jgi:hypothetical protein
VPAHFAPRVAERFEGCDLFALRLNEPRHHDVKEKSRYCQEYHRDDQSHPAQLLHFVGYELMGWLVGSTVGSQATVRRGEAVQLAQHFRLGGVRRQGHSRVVEGPFHVECCSQFRVAHPENAEAAAVGQYLAGRKLVDVFRRQRHADHAQWLFAAVDNGQDLIAWLEAVRQRERFANQHFIAVPWLDIPAAA